MRHLKEFFLTKYLSRKFSGNVFRGNVNLIELTKVRLNCTSLRMSEDLDKCYDVVVKAIKHVGQIIRERIWEIKSKVNTKCSDIDFVTDTDQEVERYLISTLKSNFPSHLFVGEESVSEGTKLQLTNTPTWIIDPVDGTMNFVHGYPNVCVSVALLVDKIPQIGIIYNPVIDYFFEARKGGGAMLNGRAIHVSRTTDLSKALVSFEIGTSQDSERKKNITENLLNLIGQTHGLRSTGSAAMNMAMVALGGSDAYFEFGIHAWDVAAGDLLVREAGGVVIDPAGDAFDVLSRRVLCASSALLANELSQRLIQFYPERD